MSFSVVWDHAKSARDGGVFRIVGDTRQYSIDWGDGSTGQVTLPPDRDQNGEFVGYSPQHHYDFGGKNSVTDIAVTEGDTVRPVVGLDIYFFENRDQPGTFQGRRSSDLIFASEFDDRVAGGESNDLLYGNGGDDRLVGGPRQMIGHDADQLFGDARNDRLVGNSGDDRLEGDAGRDRLTGGTGADTFVFVRPVDDAGVVGTHDPDRDTVVDFHQGEDKLDVSDWATNFTFVGTAAFSHSGAPELREVYNAGHTVVIGDYDGDGTADFSFRLPQHVELTAADFVG